MPDRLVAELREKFGIENLVGFDLGNGRLPRIVVTTPPADAHIYLHGAHVTHYRRRGQAPLLFVSDQSLFQSDKAIRGGIPICWPWFGPNKNDPAAPAHGFARTSIWNLENVTQTPANEIAITLTLSPAGEIALQYIVTIGESLDLALTTTNKGDKPFNYEEALHSYFTVSDVRNIQLLGLGGSSFTSKAPPTGTFTQPPDPLLFTGETDRVYADTQAECTIVDTAEERAISVKKTGSNSTVVWNPWIEKAKSMADMGDDEWPEMLCVESGNVWHNAITLAPGESHTLHQHIATRRLATP
jgi:glucose-6-phosphate 1-epimerase